MNEPETPLKPRTQRLKQLVMLALALALLAYAVYDVYLKHPPHEYIAPDAEFAVVFPAAFERDTTTPANSTTWFAHHNGMAFHASSFYLRDNPGFQASPAAVFDKLRAFQTAFYGAKAQVSAEQSLQVNGFPAMDLHIAKADGGQGSTRIVISRQMLILLQVTAEAGAGFDAVAASAFLDSLRVQP